jgi:hypothetical protein
MTRMRRMARITPASREQCPEHLVGERRDARLVDRRQPLDAGLGLRLEAGQLGSQGAFLLLGERLLGLRERGGGVAGQRLGLAAGGLDDRTGLTPRSVDACSEGLLRLEQPAEIGIHARLSSVQRPDPCTPRGRAPRGRRAQPALAAGGKERAQILHLGLLARGEPLRRRGRPRLLKGLPRPGRVE